MRDKKLYSCHSAFDTATTVQLDLNENVLIIIIIINVIVHGVTVL